jgi:hypothetical protein
MVAKLQEVLVGPQAAKYGALPKLPLPGDDQTILRFAMDSLTLLKGKPIYRRDRVPVLLYPERARLEVLEAQTYRTWVERYFVCYKQKFDHHTGEPFDVIRSMNKETAEAVLKCVDFWRGLPEIEAVNPARSLSIDEETSEMSLLQPGYDDKTKTLTFE